MQSHMISQPVKSLIKLLQLSWWPLYNNRAYDNISHRTFSSQIKHTVNIRWAKLSRFLNLPQKFSHLYIMRHVSNEHCWPMHHESISAKNFIGLKLRMFSPVNISTSTVCPAKLSICPAKSNLARQIYYTLSMEISLSLQRKWMFGQFSVLTISTAIIIGSVLYVVEQYS